MSDKTPGKSKSASELVEQKLQALGKGPRTAGGEQPAPEAPPTAPAESAGMGMGSGNEIDMLRSIMFGSMQREMDRRLREMNDSVTLLSQMLDERADLLSKDTDERLTKAQKEASERDERVATELSKAQKETRERTEQQLAELRQQVKTLGDELRQSQTALRNEIMGLLKALEESKTSRQALGELLVEMGQRLRGDGKKG